MATANAAPVTLSMLAGFLELLRQHLPDVCMVPAPADERPRWRGFHVGVARRGVLSSSSRVDRARLNRAEALALTPDPGARALSAVLAAYGKQAERFNAHGPGQLAHRAHGVAVESWGALSAPRGPVAPHEGAHDVAALVAAAGTMIDGATERAAAAELLAGALLGSEETGGPWLVAAALAGVELNVDVTAPGYTHPLAAVAGLLPVPDCARLDAVAAVVARDLAPLVREADRGPVFGLLAWLAWMAGRKAEARHWIESGRARELPMGMLGEVAAATPVAPWRVAGA